MNPPAQAPTATPRESAPRAPLLTVTDIIKSAAQSENVSFAAIMSDDGRHRTCRARALAIWLVFKVVDGSLPKIGWVFGRRHPTVLHAIRAHENRIAGDPMAKRKSEMLLARILAGEFSSRRAS